MTALEVIEAAPSSAELIPLSDGAPAQIDEIEMGLTYNELTILGRLRKSERCGPFSTFSRLVPVWKDIPVQEVLLFLLK